MPQIRRGSGNPPQMNRFRKETIMMRAAQPILRRKRLNLIEFEANLGSVIYQAVANEDQEPNEDSANLCEKFTFKFDY